MVDKFEVETISNQDYLELLSNELAESFDKFESLCHRLVDYDGNLDLQLETWLMAIGKQKEIDAWRDSMND